MATEAAANKPNVLTYQDVLDFNDALSLVFIAGSLEDVSGLDEGIHLRNLCRVATQKLCDIRNRLNPEGIELEATP